MNIVKSYNYAVFCLCYRMPRPTGNWKKQDETNWLVLDRLVRTGPQNLPSLEKRNRRYKLPHASVRIGIQQLQQDHLVSVSSIDNSIPRRPIKTFVATRLGLLTWFATMTQKSGIDYSMINSKQMKDILPILSRKWQLLKKFYVERHMIRLLGKVFSNIEVLFDNPFILKYKTFYRGATIEFKNTQEKTTIDVPIDYAIEFQTGLETMVNFAFFLELYKLHDVDNHYESDDIVGLKKETSINDWLSIVKSEKMLLEQISTGFNTMKKYSENADKGLREDLDFILGKEMDFCEICTEPYTKNKPDEHLKLHKVEELERFYDRSMLLSRSDFEYELEFHRKNVVRFDKFLEVLKNR